MQGGRFAAGLRSDPKPLVPLKVAFKGCEGMPPKSYGEIVAGIESSGLIPDFAMYAEMNHQGAKDAVKFGKLKGTKLSVDEVWSIMKYTSEDTEPSLYSDMNGKCYDSNRTPIKMYVDYMWLLLHALKKLEPYQGQTVFRGVKEDLKSKYPEGREFTWHGFSSTTSDIGVLSNDMFCGTSGKRTIFAIELTQGQGRSISDFSLIESEDEILLPPGSSFEVMGVLPQGDLTIINVKEKHSLHWIMDLGTGGKIPDKGERHKPAYKPAQVHPEPLHQSMEPKQTPAYAQPAYAQTPAPKYADSKLDASQIAGCHFVCGFLFFFMPGGGCTKITATGPDSYTENGCVGIIPVCSTFERKGESNTFLAMKDGQNECGEWADHYPGGFGCGASYFGWGFSQRLC